MSILENLNKTLFISYSHRQMAWCRALDHAIDRETPYQRWRDNKIPGSSRWWKIICGQIESCFAFIAVVTGDYLDSKFCMAELQYARRLNKPIIVLLLEDVAYPSYLQNVQAIRVASMNMLEIIKEILIACNEIILSYVAGDFSTDVHARPHLRPPLPQSDPPGDKDTQSNTRITSAGNIHDAIATSDLVESYDNALQKGNFRLARQLLDRIANRDDLDDSILNINEEYEGLLSAESNPTDAGILSAYQKRIRRIYQLVTERITRVPYQKAQKIVQRFLKIYPDFGDPEKKLEAFLPPSQRLMPQPFAWVDIESKDYSISKYPVTNAQFACFIEAGGYQKARWWTLAGWEARRRGWRYQSSRDRWEASHRPWTAPRFWEEVPWNRNDHPVVGISWHEAIAFCLWLREKSGEAIMLPTSNQWIYAARGDDNRIYPWGNLWDCNRCNNSLDHCHSNGTTRVGDYEGYGNSYFGVTDMSGNIWEWCMSIDEKMTSYATSSNKRLVRGGSWYCKQRGGFRCDGYFLYHPHSWFSDVGFRLARMLPDTQS